MSHLEFYWINEKFKSLKKDLETIINSKTKTDKYLLLLKIKEDKKTTTLNHLVDINFELHIQSEIRKNISDPLKDLIQLSEEIVNKNIEEKSEDPTEMIKKILHFVDNQIKNYSLN